VTRIISRAVALAGVTLSAFPIASSTISRKNGTLIAHGYGIEPQPGKKALELTYL
jgi:hypothetical protein